MVEQEVLVVDHEVLVELQEKNPIWPPVTGPVPGLAFKGLKQSRKHDSLNTAVLNQRILVTG